MALEKQMELFNDGGLLQEGGSIDEESGNDVPVGSLKEEVRDDIPAQLSEGEFVMPADVVRFHGLDKMMALRDEAKMGLQRMEDMGQMGNAEEATIPDGVPFNIDDLDIEDDPVEMQAGGFVQPQFTPGGMQQSQFEQYQPQFTPYQMPNYAQAPMPTYTPPMQAPVPMAPTNIPQFGQFVTPTYATYVNDAGGIISIPVDANGNPLIPVPAGYRKQESGAGSTETAATPTTPPVTTAQPQIDPNEDNDPPGPNEAQEKIKERIAAAKSLGYTKQQTTGEALLSLLPFGSDTPERGTILANGNIADGQGNSFDPITGKQAGFLGITNLGKGDNKVNPQMMELGVTPASTAGLRTKAGDASIRNVVGASKDGPLPDLSRLASPANRVIGYDYDPTVQLVEPRPADFFDISQAPEITDSARVETAQVTAEEGTAAGEISPAVQAKAEELGIIIRNALNLNEEDGMDFLVTLAEGPANQKATYNSAPETMVNFNEYDSEHREAAKILLENIEEKGDTSTKNILRNTRTKIAKETAQDEEKGPDVVEKPSSVYQDSILREKEKRDAEIRRQAEAIRIANEAAAAKAAATQQRDDNDSPFENQTSYSIGSGGGSRTIGDDAGGGYETGRGFFADGGLAAKKKPKPKKMKRGGLASKK